MFFIVLLKTFTVPRMHLVNYTSKYNTSYFVHILKHVWWTELTAVQMCCKAAANFACCFILLVLPHLHYSSAAVDLCTYVRRRIPLASYKYVSYKYAAYLAASHASCRIELGFAAVEEIDAHRLFVVVVSAPLLSAVNPCPLSPSYPPLPLPNIPDGVEAVRGNKAPP